MQVMPSYMRGWDASNAIIHEGLDTSNVILHEGLGCK